MDFYPIYCIYIIKNGVCLCMLVSWNTKYVFIYLFINPWQIVNNSWQIVNNSCQIVNNSCQIVNDSCQIVNNSCQIVNNSWQIVNNSCQIVNNSWQIVNVLKAYIHPQIKLDGLLSYILYIYHKEWRLLMYVSLLEH